MRRIRTPEDIQTLPGYIARVDPEVTPLSRILDYYYIRPFEIRCALCGQPHMDGCLVELEDSFSFDGVKKSSVTNIGHICGDRFGDRFGEERRKYSESQRKPELIRKMVDAKTRISSIQFEIAEQRHQCDAMARRMSNFSNVFPATSKELARRASENRHQVFESIERNSDEIDEAHAANPFKSREELRFREVLRGTIQGYKFAGFDWSFDTGLRRIFPDVSKFEDLNPRAMSMQDLTKWSNWAEDFEENFTRVKSAIGEGASFFTVSNFRLFSLLPGTVEMRDKLKSFDLSSLDQLKTIPVSETVKPAIKVGRIAKNAGTAKMSVKELRRLTGDKKAVFK